MKSLIIIIIIIILSSCILFSVSGIKNKSTWAKGKTAVFQGKVYDGKVYDSKVYDSKMNFNEAVKGLDIPRQIIKDLLLVDVEYYSTDNRLHRGQVLVHKLLAVEIKEIFEEIKSARFPIYKAIPISIYQWSDSLSMLDNNTSCFNYRMVKGTRILSAHAKGKAIDINPFLNPQVKNKKRSPEKAVYNPNIPGTLSESSPVVKAFKKRGWKWGGNWRTMKDYQHFEKR